MHKRSFNIPTEIYIQEKLEFNPPNDPLPLAPSYHSKSVLVSLFHEWSQSPNPVDFFSYHLQNMTSASFQLEYFQPWNPFWDKPQPLPDSLDVVGTKSYIDHYHPGLSPILAIKCRKVQKFIPHKPEQHLSPSYRLPVEVCLDSGLRSAS